MALELSPKLSKAFADALTPATSRKPHGTEVTIGYVAIADVDGLAEKINAGYPLAATKSHAVAIFSNNGLLGSATVYTANSARDAEDTMLEMAYHAVEDLYC